MIPAARLPRPRTGWPACRRGAASPWVGLGGGQEPGAETGGRDHRFRDLEGAVTTGTGVYHRRRTALRSPPGASGSGTGSGTLGTRTVRVLNACVRRRVSSVMPTYEYACKSCGEHLEVVQSFKDEPLTECPACGGPLRKVFGNIGIAFKGSGFYKNDSRASGGGRDRAGAARQVGGGRRGRGDSGTALRRSRRRRDRSPRGRGRDRRDRGPDRLRGRARAGRGRAGRARARRARVGRARAGRARAGRGRAASGSGSGAPATSGARRRPPSALVGRTNPYSQRLADAPGS